MTSLRVTNGPAAGQEVKVEKDLVIGREKADLTIEDEQLSSRHAVVRPSAGGLEIEDLASSNGTYVDGRRIDSPTKVGNGVRIKLGSTVLEVEGGEAAQRAAAGPTASDEPVADPKATQIHAAIVPPPDSRPPDARPPDAPPADAPPLAGSTASRGEPGADPQGSRSRPVADPEATRARRAKLADEGVPGAAKPAPTAPAPGRARAGTGLSVPVGTFSPPARRRSRGLASRSWAPTALSFGTAIAVLVALIIYFVAR